MCGLSQEAQLQGRGLSAASHPSHQADAGGLPAGAGLPLLYPGYGPEQSVPQGCPDTAPSPPETARLSLPALEELWPGMQDDREELQTCLLKEQLPKLSFGGPQGVPSAELVLAKHAPCSTPVALCDLGDRDLLGSRSGSSSACYALATDLPGALDAAEAPEADRNTFSWDHKELFFSKWTDRTSDCSCASSECVGTATPSLAGSEVDVSAGPRLRAEVLDDRELSLLTGTYFNLGEGRQFCETHLDLDRTGPSDTLERDHASSREGPGGTPPRLGAVPTDTCPSEGPGLSIQVTSTPVRGDSLGTPEAPSLQREIQEGTYTGSCCHRDGSLLSMSWAGVSSSWGPRADVVASRA